MEIERPKEILEEDWLKTNEHDKLKIANSFLIFDLFFTKIIPMWLNDCYDIDSDKNLELKYKTLTEIKKTGTFTEINKLVFEDYNENADID